MKVLMLIATGVVAGLVITLQGVFNAGLGQKIGNLGSVFIVSCITALVLVLWVLSFPASVSFRQLPGMSDWYLYLGGLLGVGIIAAPVFLIPRIGATLTLAALMVGQLLMALVIDHFGWFHVPKIEINSIRILGILFLISGAFLVKQ